MSGAITALVLAAAGGAAVNGGVFYAFSSFVMPALGRLQPTRGAAAMQSMNVTAVRPPFMLLFLGTAALSVAVVVAALLELDEPYAPWLLGGAALYLVGVLGLTIAFHVPRNDALAALSPEAADTATAWARYLREWTAGNHVRAAAGVLSAAALAIGVEVA